MLAIFKREFKSYFTSPLGFTILAAFYFFSGLSFQSQFSRGEPYVEYILFSLLTYIIILVPVITMRLFSDERRQKTDQVIFTAPIKLINVVLGKFFAAFALFAMCFLPTIVYEIIVNQYVKVNLFYYLYALLGVLLFGMALIAIGMFISTLTESPITATVLTLLVNLFLTSVGGLSELVSSKVAVDPTKFFEKAWALILTGFSKFLSMFNITKALNSFAEQAFAFNDIIYFLTITAAFIFLTERMLEKRRWS